MKKINYYIIIVLLVLTLGASFFLFPFPEKPTLASGSLWVADSFGYLGLGMLCWSLALGTRDICAHISLDLEKVVRVHKWLGKYGIIAILLHPVLMVVAYSTTPIFIIRLSAVDRFEAHLTLGRLAFILFLLLWITSVVLCEKMGFRPWKYLHYIFYIVTAYALAHIPFTGSYFAEYLNARVYYFVCLGVFVFVTLVKVGSLFNLGRADYRVTNILSYGGQCQLLELTPLKGGRITPVFGQYVYIKTGIISEDHPFSIAYYDINTGRIFIYYRIVGSFTRELSKVKIDSELSVAGPYGQFFDSYLKNPCPAVFVGAGAGVAPLVQICSVEGLPEQWMFYSCRTTEQLAIVTDVKANLGDRLITTVTRPAEGETASNVRSGRFDADEICRHLKDPSAYDYYLCGPERMVDSIRGSLKHRGVKRSQIHVEIY